MYFPEPNDKNRFKANFDKAYTRFAGLYDFIVKTTSVWRNWISQAIPYIQGPRVLEISFGTGYLISQYADRYDVYGIDYNQKMVQKAKTNLERMRLNVRIQQADVENLPYKAEAFDSVINTMSFTGYPDGVRAMAEIHRVLKKGGTLIIIDVNYPSNGNWLGTRLTRFWASFGDIIRDMDELFKRFELVYDDREIGGFGSVHLYLATKGRRGKVKKAQGIK